MGRADLQVVSGGVEVIAASALDAATFEATCIEGFAGSRSARGFSDITIENATGVLERFLALLGMPAWEAGPADIDRVVAELVVKGMAASTRRGYVQAFKDFHRYLVSRKTAEIEATFGVHISDPLDEFNAARHVGNDSPSTRPPPTPERMVDFFEFLRDRIATARKFGSVGRDYALFRTLYHGGLRAWASPGLTDIHHQVRSTGKDAHHGDHGAEEAPHPKVVHPGVQG